MDAFLKFKESEEDQKMGSVEACAFVTKPRRRIRMIVDLAGNSEAEKEKLKIQEEIRAAIYVHKAAFEFIEKKKLEDVLSRECSATEASETSSFQEPVDDVASTVEGHDVFQLPAVKCGKCARAVIYILLEAASLFLDLFGKNKRGILLAAFLLSVFGFAMSIYTCIMGRTRAATRVYCQKQLVSIVEIAFSVVQLVVTLIYYILAESGVKNNFSASIFPLVFAIIVAVFTFKYNEEVSDSSGGIDNNLSGDLTEENLNSLRDLNTTTYNFASPVPPAADHQLNRQCQFPNTQVHMPNDTAAQQRANEDAEADELDLDG